MADIKHVGRVKSNGRKCLVVFRVLPNDPEHCLILTTQNLEDGVHDAVINLVESNAGQTAYELGEAMARATLPDGSTMLPRFHATQQLQKVKTTEIEMTPNSGYSVPLNELNEAIASQKGITVTDLALAGNDAEVETIATSDVVPPPLSQQIIEDAVPTTNEPLSDEALASQYRSQADAMFKEAKRLREQAEELVPTKRKTKASA